MAKPGETVSLEDFIYDEMEMEQSEIRDVKRTELPVTDITNIRKADHIRISEVPKPARDAIVEKICHETGELSVIEFVFDQYDAFLKGRAERKKYNLFGLMSVNVLLYEEEFSPKKVIESAKKFLVNNDFATFFEKSDHFATWCKTGINLSIPIKNSSTSTFWSAVIVGLSKLADNFCISLLAELVEKFGPNLVGAAAGGIVKITFAIKELFGLFKIAQKYDMDREYFTEKLIMLISKHTVGLICIILATMLTTPVSIPGYILAMVFVFVSGIMGDCIGLSFGKFIIIVRRKWADILQYLHGKFKQAEAKAIEIYRKCKDALYRYVSWFFSQSETCFVTL